MIRALQGYQPLSFLCLEFSESVTWIFVLFLISNITFWISACYIIFKISIKLHDNLPQNSFVSLDLLQY